MTTENIRHTCGFCNRRIMTKLIGENRYFYAHKTRRGSFGKKCPWSWRVV